MNPEFSGNRRLIAGMVIVTLLYDFLNRKLNEGKGLADNPTNRKFALRVPMENGDVTYVELFPSFLATPRNMATGVLNLAQGDFKGATQKFGSVFSMPIKTTTEILGNSDYFGRQIYNDNDSTSDKLKKIGVYAGLSVNHPYIKETVNQIQDTRPLYQSLITALELPLKFSSESKEATSRMYERRDEISIENKAKEKEIIPIYNQVKSLVESGNSADALEIINSLTDEQKETYKKYKTKMKTEATNQGKKDILPIVLQVQRLVKSGNTEEAKAIVSGLSEDEKKYFKSVKESLSK